MRNLKLKKELLRPDVNDMRDWYFIAFIALASALVPWLPLLGKLRL